MRWRILPLWFRLPIGRHTDPSEKSSASQGLLPGFLNGDATRLQHEIGPTSYLIALRGLAACIVINCHLGLQLRWRIFMQPFLGIAVNGNGVVCLFFVISGYSLSYKPLLLMQRRDGTGLLKSLAGSVFRRYLRLYIPCVVAIIAMILVTSTGAVKALVKTTLIEQFADGFEDIRVFISPFQDISGYWSGWTFRSRYLFQLWTIPIEYRGSLAIYLALLGTAMLTRRLRMYILAGLTVLAYYYHIIYIALFLAGAVLAERSIAHHERLTQHNAHSVDAEAGFDTRLHVQTNGPLLAPPRQTGVQSTSPLYKALAIAALTFGVFVLSIPAAITPGALPIFRIVHNAVPSGWDPEAPGTEQFYEGIAAILIIWGFEAWPRLQQPLCWPLLQYIGDLSFGIYALHVIFVSALDTSLLHPWFAESPADLTNVAELAFQPTNRWLLLPQVFVTYFVSFWCADYFTRMDKKLVNWGYALQNRCFIKF